MSKKTGIWIDKKQAYLIHIIGNQTKMEEVISGIDDFHPKGGSRSKTVYGPVITVKEKAYLNREKLQVKQFFEDVISKIRDAKQVYIFGPAEMKNQLNNYLKDQQSLSPIIIGIETRDRMTQNQMIAEVKSAFS